MEIPLLPNERDNAAVKKAYKAMYGNEKTERYPGFTGFLAARMAAYYAYGMTGIVDPCAELDLVELHDAFTISDIQTYEDIGLRPYGSGPDYVESGDAYLTVPKDGSFPAKLAGKPGRLPSNLSGGLIGCMHAGLTASCRWPSCSGSPERRSHRRAPRWKRFGGSRGIVSLQVPAPRPGDQPCRRGRTPARSPCTPARIKK
jgi:hypothetical protein